MSTPLMGTPNSSRGKSLHEEAALKREPDFWFKTTLFFDREQYGNIKAVVRARGVHLQDVWSAMLHMMTLDPVVQGWALEQARKLKEERAEQDAAADEEHARAVSEVGSELGAIAGGTQSAIPLTYAEDLAGKQVTIPRRIWGMVQAIQFREALHSAFLTVTLAARFLSDMTFQNDVVELAREYRYKR